MEDSGDHDFLSRDCQFDVVDPHAGTLGLDRVGSESSPRAVTMTNPCIAT